MVSDDAAILSDPILAMPKVELHVHLEGAIPPATMLALAARNGVALPVSDEQAARQWLVFRDFPHFAEIYQTISRCIRTAEDVNRLARDFLQNQAAQNILHTEVTYTALTHWRNAGLPFEEQVAALDDARAWAEAALGVTMLVIMDIPREIVTPEEARMTAERAVRCRDRGVVALGLGGYEVGFPPEDFVDAFAVAHEAGLPAVVHAGETESAESVRGALHALRAVRIGHGIRCLEDPDLVAELRDRKVPLEVCPGSNVALRVVPDLASHPLPRMLKEGLRVSLNTDDPPLFGTDLVMEHRRAAQVFGLSMADLARLARQAGEDSLLDAPRKAALLARLTAAEATAMP